jgi:malate dehydrogenase (oxaloacetate-decarboxylating)(NADP+)
LVKGGFPFFFHGVPSISFGPEYLIPNPLDTRIISWEAPSVAEAAMDAWVARTTMDLAECAKRLVARRKHSVRACGLVCEVPT